MLFVCSVDARSANSVRLVLTMQGLDSVPRLLEGCRLPREARFKQIMAKLDGWKRLYRADLDVAVCSDSDGLPRHWAEALASACGTFEWVSEGQLASLMAAWQDTVPGPLWLRGTLMSLVYGLPGGGYPSDCDEPYGWLQAWLRSQLRDLPPYGDDLAEVPF